MSRRLNVIGAPVLGLLFIGGLAACTDDDTVATTAQGVPLADEGYAPDGTIGRPVVDGAGLVWLTSTSAEGRITLAAIGTETATSLELEGTQFPQAGPPNIALAPGGSGVVLTAAFCADGTSSEQDGCYDQDPLVKVGSYRLSDDGDVSPGSASWEQAVKPDDAVSPVPVGSSEDQLGLWRGFEQQVLLVGSESVEAVELPETTTQACLVDGVLMALTDPSDGADVEGVVVGDETSPPPEAYEVSVSVLREGEWQVLDASRRTVGSAAGYPEFVLHGERDRAGSGRRGPGRGRGDVLLGWVQLDDGRGG